MRATLKRLFVLLALTSLLGLASAPASAQTTGPQITPRDPPVSVGRAPNPPVLFAPADNHVINAVTGVPSQIFTWDPPPSGPSVVFYYLSFTNADNAAAFSMNPIRIEAAGGRVSTNQIIPPALAGARINWSVRACNNEPGLTVIGAPPGNCGQAASRLFTWSTAVQPPQLYSPANGTTVPVGSQFTWHTVFGASEYLFCISRPGVACPTTETNTNDTIVVRRTGNSATFAAPDTLRFNGVTMNWTAAACGASGTCVYQQNVRAVTVSFSPPQLISPANNAFAPPNSQFSWSAVTGANQYLFCISRPGVACPTTETNTNDTIVVRRTGNSATFAAPDTLRFNGVTMNWTAAACAGPTACLYQSSVRVVTVGSPPPSPDFTVDVAPVAQSIVWGQSAAYTVSVRSRNGFNQAVTLAATNLPDGASSSFSPMSVTSPVNGAATATLTIATALAGTEHGKSRFRISGTDPSGRTRRDDVDITVLRQGGAFSSNVFPLRSVNAPCGGASATIVSGGTPPGPRVQFMSALGTTNPAPLFGPGYDFSPNCRVGLVIPPAGAQPFVNLFNLGFAPATGANGINSPHNFPSLAVEARFSPDDSIVAIVGPGQVAGQSSLVLHDIVQRSSSAPQFFVGSITSMTLAGEEVTVVWSGGQPLTMRVP